MTKEGMIGTHAEDASLQRHAPYFHCAVIAASGKTNAHFGWNQSLALHPGDW